MWIRRRWRVRRRPRRNYASSRSTKSTRPPAGTRRRPRGCPACVRRLSTGPQPLIPAAGPSNFRCSSPPLALIPADRMHWLLDFLHRIRDVRAIIAWGGYVGLTAIIFAETGLLIGFFLPGDSLLVTAGLLAATTGVFNVFGLGLLLSVASIVGNTVGYGIGRAA